MDMQELARSTSMSKKREGSLKRRGSKDDKAAKAAKDVRRGRRACTCGKRVCVCRTASGDAVTDLDPSEFDSYL